MKIPIFNPTGVLAPIADWARAVRQVLSGGLTIADQMHGELKTIRWNGSAPGVTFSTKLTTRPVGIVMLDAWTDTNPDQRISGGFLSWTWKGASPAQISLLSLDSLGASVDWNVTLWIVGG